MLNYLLQSVGREVLDQLFNIAKGPRDEKINITISGHGGAIITF